MEEEKLKNLFEQYTPELSSDSMFLNRLQRNLDMVEYLKKHSEQSRRRSRLAIVIAGIAGFILGILVTLCYPKLYDFMSPLKGFLDKTLLFDALLWGIVGFTVIVFTYAVYDLSLIIINNRQKKILGI